MNIIQTSIEGCFIINPVIHNDERGYFYEFFNKKNFEQATGIAADFVQDNQAYSKGKVLRGFHFQKGEHAQAKLVSASRGRVQDVIIDLRASSPSYRRVVSVILDDESKNQVYVPRGCAHGYLTLDDEVIFSYKCDNYYNKESEAGLNPSDPSLSIEWETTIEDAIISDRDRALPMWDESYKFD